MQIVILNVVSYVFFLKRCLCLMFVFFSFSIIFRFVSFLFFSLIMSVVPLCYPLWLRHNPLWPWLDFSSSYFFCYFVLWFFLLHNFFLLFNLCLFEIVSVVPLCYLCGCGTSLLLFYSLFCSRKIKVLNFYLRELSANCNLECGVIFFFCYEYVYFF